MLRTGNTKTPQFFKGSKNKISGTQAAVKNSLFYTLEREKLYYTGYFTSDNEPDEIENATHNTFAKLTRIFLI
jgi:hypothetical protein